MASSPASGERTAAEYTKSSQVRVAIGGWLVLRSDRPPKSATVQKTTTPKSTAAAGKYSFVTTFITVFNALPPDWIGAGCHRVILSMGAPKPGSRQDAESVTKITSDVPLDCSVQARLRLQGGQRGTQPGVGVVGNLLHCRTSAELDHCLWINGLDGGPIRVATAAHYDIAGQQCT